MKDKKQEAKKGKRAEVDLSPEESQEMEMLLDRLSVQNPGGQSFESFLLSLHQALSGRELFVAALIERLSRNPTEVGFRTTTMLQDLVQSKVYRRLTKQAGYRFSQRGFAAAVEPAAGQPVVLIPRETRKPVAHVIPTAEAFSFITVLVEESSTLSPVAVSAYAEEGFRKLNVKVVDSSHKLYREFIEKIADHFSRRPLEVPVEHAARLYFEMHEFAGAGEVVGDSARAAQILKPFYDPSRLPYAYELMPAVELPEKMVEGVDIRLLVDAISIDWLLFPREDLMPYRERVQDLERPVLVVPREIQEERTGDLIRKAADELCTGKTRTYYQRLFEELTLWLKLSGKHEAAASAWLVAQHLASPASAGENPMIMQIVLLSMQYYWPKDFEESEQVEEEGFHRTDSGLILP